MQKAAVFLGYGYLFWKMNRNKLILALGIVLVLMGSFSTSYAQSPHRDPQQIEAARATNTKQSMLWVLFLATVLIGLLTVALFLVYFPKGYRTAHQQQNETPVVMAQIAIEPSIPAPRVIFLKDDSADEL